MSYHRSYVCPLSAWCAPLLLNSPQFCVFELGDDELRALAGIDHSKPLDHSNAYHLFRRLVFLNLWRSRCFTIGAILEDFLDCLSFSLPGPVGKCWREEFSYRSKFGSEVTGLGEASAKQDSTSTQNSPSSNNVIIKPENIIEIHTFGGSLVSCCFDCWASGLGGHFLERLNFNLGGLVEEFGVVLAVIFGQVLLQRTEVKIHFLAGLNWAHKPLSVVLNR